MSAGPLLPGISGILLDFVSILGYLGEADRDALRLILVELFNVLRCPSEGFVAV